MCTCGLVPNQALKIQSRWTAELKANVWVNHALCTVDLDTRLPCTTVHGVCIHPLHQCVRCGGGFGVPYHILYVDLLYVCLWCESVCV